MSQTHNVNLQEENELQKIWEQVTRHYYLFIFGIVLALGIAFIINQYSTPVYKISSSILIKENQRQQDMGDFINSNLFGTNQNLQNELLLLKSSPVISQTIRNLDLPVSYYQKKGFQKVDAYKNVPFRVMYLRNHVQPVRVQFEITFSQGNSFRIKAESEEVALYHFEENVVKSEKADWVFHHEGKLGQLIETPDLSFIIELDSSRQALFTEGNTFYFSFTDVPTLTEVLQGELEFKLVDIEATAIEISLKSNLVEKGLDIINGIADVYSNQNLEKKNHLADITIDYIDKQIGEIADSLSQTEQTLQSFRSSNQLLNVTEQASGISTQYRDLENQRAELVTRKRYYEYVSDYLAKNEDFTNIIVPSSLGIQDQLLNNLMGELITAQAQKSNLIENNQEKNPLVKKLGIQIDNLKKTISENIAYVLKTSEISMDELNKRIGKIEAQISRMPKTERQLTGIERKFRLNDAIYNYLMEKRAEANITRASNLPDNEIIEAAKMVGTGPVSPNKKMNYAIAFILGIVVPFGYLQLKSAFNSRLENQEQIERITDVPVLGKILHNTKKTHNVVFEFPNSSIAEAYRALRTNLEYYVRGGHKKVIMVTSCIEGEGKSFNAINIAMSYAQFNRKTIILDFDLRKPNTYFNKKGESLVGLSSYLINKAVLEDIIIQSPHDRLDYIPSGPIPPNPVELIGLEKTEKLINQLKELYDYIIIDTPPLAQVTDAYLLIEQTDVKVLITRYNYTLKSVFSFIMYFLL
ncbi:MAG: polysaccharide biosynthesis tyrosine autokinase [Bacteroidetes bacterium]|nr:polysaccharide biosynthesis tyrosine autokinase [Bacteroidota bacterium]